MLRYEGTIENLHCYIQEERLVQENTKFREGVRGRELFLKSSKLAPLFTAFLTKLQKFAQATF